LTSAIGRLTEEKRGRTSNPGGERRRRRSRRQAVETSIPDHQSETLYQEYLENGGCDGWEKLTVVKENEITEKISIKLK
jgi:hypothetical protein